MPVVQEQGLALPSLNNSSTRTRSHLQPNSADGKTHSHLELAARYFFEATAPILSDLPGRSVRRWPWQLRQLILHSCYPSLNWCSGISARLTHLDVPSRLARLSRTFVVRRARRVRLMTIVNRRAAHKGRVSPPKHDMS